MGAGPDERRSAFDEDFLARLSAMSHDSAHDMSRAFLAGGRESWPYYRLHSLATHGDSTFPSVLEEWLDGASFGFAWRSGNSDARMRLAESSTLQYIASAWRAAESALRSYLEGLIDGSSEPALLCVGSSHSARIAWEWKQSAAILGFGGTYFERSPAAMARPPEGGLYARDLLAGGPGVLVAAVPMWATWAFDERAAW
jgi:hypothetical protein